MRTHGWRTLDAEAARLKKLCDHRYVGEARAREKSWAREAWETVYVTAFLIACALLYCWWTAGTQ